MKFLSGLADCHLPGLYSLVLSERVSPEVGMRRVFYAGQNCEMDLWDGADFRLKPHNHRQSIKLTLLFGEAINVAMKWGRWSGDEAVHVWKYRFTSALLNGQFGTERMDDIWCTLKEIKLSSTPLRLHWSDVHTVTAKPGSAWLVEELERAPDGSERCYSVSHRLSLSNDGLYHSMPDGEVEAISQQINQRLPERFPQ